MADRVTFPSAAVLQATHHWAAGLAGDDLLTLTLKTLDGGHHHAYAVQEKQEN